jgi:ApeA N-terminal domain 1/Apea-like HEPN
VVGTDEYRGFWWLPEDDSRRLYGTLSVSNGDPRLELLQNFGQGVISESETQKVFSHALEERPRILGVTIDGEPITLEGAQVLSSSQRFPGIATSTYGLGVALVGAHFAAGEQLGFDEISIQASDLNTWTQLSGFEIQLGMDEHEEHGYLFSSKVGITFQSPDEIDITLARGERAFIRFNASSEGLGPVTDHISLKQEAAFHLRFGKRASLREVFDRVGHLRNFLSLAIGRPVTILSVTGYQADFVREQTGQMIPIELLWQIPHNPDPPVRRHTAREMLFTLPEAKPNISGVMRAWFAKQERLAPVFSLFFGSRYHPDLSLDVRFLLHAQAAETYDYRRRRNPRNDSFAERIGSLLDRCKSVSKQIVGSSPTDRHSFIEAVKIARNYYTHYNPKLETKVARGAALLVLLLELQALLEMALLREMGLPARSIDEILRRVRRYEEIEHFKRVVNEEGAKTAR